MWSKELGFWDNSVPCSSAAYLLYFRLSNYVTDGVGQWLSKCCPRIAALVSPGHLLEMHILRWKVRMGLAPAVCALTSPLADSCAEV